MEIHLPLTARGLCIRWSSKSDRKFIFGNSTKIPQPVRTMTINDWLAAHTQFCLESFFFSRCVSKGLRLITTDTKYAYRVHCCFHLIMHKIRVAINLLFGPIQMTHHNLSRRKQQRQMHSTCGYFQLTHWLVKMVFKFNGSFFFSVDTNFEYHFQSNMICDFRYDITECIYWGGGLFFDVNSRAMHIISSGYFLTRKNSIP